MAFFKLGSGGGSNQQSQNVSTNTRVDTFVTNTLIEREALDAKNVYVGSDEQAMTYDTPHPYAELIADLIGSMRPKTVLEFGCNAGRNLDQIRRRVSDAQLTGVDINPKGIELGRKQFGLDLQVADEDWLTRQAEDVFDVSLTVSVIDHMPYPETVLRHLLRLSKHYLVLFELAHDRIGKATHNIYIDADKVSLKQTYRYSYIHDYRYECERKFGAHCIVDLKFPIGSDNLIDLYRLYVFSKQPALRDTSVVQSVLLHPIRATLETGSDQI